MVKAKQTAWKYRPKLNPFLSDDNEPESSDMNQDQLISNSLPASPDEAQPALPLAQGEVMQDEPTESMENPDIPEMNADNQEVEELSNMDEIQEIEEAEDVAAIEADEDSSSKSMKK